MNETNLLKKIRRIQYQTSRLATDLLPGAYRSAFKGRGLEFDEVREYRVGDDVRSIDWNVTARMNHPYVKSYCDEREITLTLIIDVSPSTCMGSGKALKNEVIVEIAAWLFFAAIKNGDKVAVVVFTDRVEKYFPPGKGTRHVLTIIRFLLAYEPIGKGTDIGKALEYFVRLKHRSGICFVLSDCIDKNFSKEAALAALRNDLVFLCFIDQMELGSIGGAALTFKDPETLQVWDVDTSSKEWQETVKESTFNRLQALRKDLRKVGADFCPITCSITLDKSYYVQLKRFFYLRHQRL